MPQADRGIVLFGKAGEQRLRPRDQPGGFAAHQRAKIGPAGGKAIALAAFRLERAFGHQGAQQVEAA